MEIMKNTHTWMGESIKVGLRFSEPFWRSKNSSGTIFSNVGPISEFYDHSNYEDNLFALKGFLNGSFFSVSQEERIEMVMRQLQKYYGKIVTNFIDYEELVWRNEPLTYASYEKDIFPHQNNGNAVYQKPYWEGKFFIAGSETARQFPGYLEGAIRSAYAVVEQLEKMVSLKGE